ncbi:uncharacterized protein LOC117611954 [Osmia lignaria lignaria]|uniref:uncharacterized protein LOC117611954 n=1 Tax=Osmia lignaria lignaria TaxID=1437193 RepID=UPI00402B8176
MYSQALFFYSVIYYSIVRVQCTAIFLTTPPVNPIDRDSRDRWKFLEENVPVEEGSPPFDWKFQRELPYEGVSIGGWVNNEFFQKFREDKGEGTVLFSVDECSRYCIKNGSGKDDEDFQYINLFWTVNITDITGDLLSNDLSRLMPETNVQGSNNSLGKCQIYLDLDCNTTETGTATNDMKNISKNVNKPDFQPSVKLVERYNLNNHTEIKFMVDTVINRIIINVDGNVSNAMIRVPIASRNGRETMITWTRKGYANGVRIDTRNPPPGEWWMKLVGDDNAKYHFQVEGVIEENPPGKLFSPAPRISGNNGVITITPHRLNIKRDPILNIEEKSDDFLKTTDSEVIKAEQRNLDARNNSKLVDDREITRERSLKRRTFLQEQNEQATKEETNNSESSVFISNTDNEFINYAEYVTFMDDDGNATIPKKFDNGDQLFEKMFSTEEQEKIRARSSIDAVDNLDIDNSEPLKANNIDISVRKIETLDNDELSEELVNYANQNTIEEKKMLIEVNRNSNLLVTPGTIHRIVFDVMNNCVLPVRYAFQVKSTPFKLYNVQPLYAWIYPGQMSKVAVDLIVPNNAAPDTANTVTFFIVGTEIKEKSVYLYVQGSVSKLTDDVKPKIEYSFNNNCAGKLAKDHCYKSHWSIDVTIEDYDSGLKRVISSPRNIYPRTEFISGTRSPVTFYYSATCCDTSAKITAIDLLDNYNTYTVDVTAWNNLSEAEIAAITVGALLALLLIILIIIIIIYCFRRKKSLDLPYTQRYGSRPPASAERTNF